MRPSKPSNTAVRPIKSVLFALALFHHAPLTAQTVLLEEGFDDPSLESRGWYDNTDVTISDSEAVSGAGALEVHFGAGEERPDDETIALGWVEAFNSGDVETMGRFRQQHLQLSESADWETSYRSMFQHVGRLEVTGVLIDRAGRVHLDRRRPRARGGGRHPPLRPDPLAGPDRTGAPLPLRRG